MHTILHIGAGQATELTQWLNSGAEKIILVEPHPELAEQLRKTTRDMSQVSVVEAAVTTNPANNQLHEYSLPEAGSLRRATGIKALFPGIKVNTTHTVATLSPEQLLANHGPQKGNVALLVIQAPGEEHSILQALISTDQLKSFSQLHLNANPEPYYQGSVAAEDTLQTLADYGYDITGENQNNPDWPGWQLARNPLKDEVSALQAENEAIKANNGQLEQRLSEKEQMLGYAESAFSAKVQTEQQAQKRLEAQRKHLVEANNRLAELVKKRAEAEQLKADAETAKQVVKKQAQLAQQITVAAQKGNEEFLAQVRALESQLTSTQEQLGNYKTEAVEQQRKLNDEIATLKQEKQQLLQGQNLSQSAVSQLEQKMEQRFNQQAGQLQQTANALGKHVTQSFQHQRQHIQNVTSLQQYFENGAQPLEFGQWAIGADLAVHLVRAIEQNNYDLIIEFGSGISTVLMARAIMNQSAAMAACSDQRTLDYDAKKPTDDYDLPQRILSFEQNKTYQQKTETALAREGLTRLVDLVLAPLVPTPNTHQKNSNTLFYHCETKLARIAQLYENRQARILILIDGPQSPEGDQRAREPALTAILQHLSAHRLDIVLDDAHRQGEQQVIEAWQTTCQQRGLSHQLRPLNTEKGAVWLTVTP
jgi:FkbM family methyltransferase